MWTGLAVPPDFQWTDAANWSGSVVPAATDDVCIGAPFLGITITISSGGQSIKSLVSNAKLVFSATSLSVAGASQFADDFTASSGTVNLNGSATVSGVLTIGGATLNFNGSSSAGTVVFNAGILGGTGAMTVSGPFTWAGGAVTGAGGFTTSGGILMNSGSVFLDGRTMTSNSNATLNGAGSNGLFLLNGAVWNQAAATTFDIQSDGGVFQGVGATGTFNNAGMVHRSTSAGIAEINVSLVNNGSVSVLTGTLQIGANFSSPGTLNGPGPYTVAPGATLALVSGQTSNIPGSLSGAGAVIFQGGTQNLTGTYTITGATTILGATVNFNTTAPVTLSTLTMTSGAGNGVLSGTADVTVAGLFTWTLGTVTTTGTAAFTTNGGILMNNSSATLGGRTLTSNSGVTMSGAFNSNFP